MEDSIDYQAHNLTKSDRKLIRSAVNSLVVIIILGIFGIGIRYVYQTTRTNPSASPYIYNYK